MTRPRLEPTPQPYPDYDFDVAKIKAHAEGLPPEERNFYLQYLCKKRKEDDRFWAGEWDYTVFAQRYLEGVLLDELFSGRPVFVPNGALDEAGIAADFEDLEEYLERARDRDERISMLQEEAQEDLGEYQLSRRMNQLARGHIASFDDDGDDLLMDLLDDEFDTHRDVERALQNERHNVSARLYGGGRGPSPRHNHDKLWERSVTACLRILKSRHESASAEDNEITVKDFAGEMEPPISKPTWYRHAKLAWKPDGTGITTDDVLKEAYRRLREETPED